MYRIVILLSVLLLNGCAATKLSLAKRDLDVQTRTSNAIFLQPTADQHPTLYLEVRSAVMEFDDGPFKAYVQDELTRNGSEYRLVDNPEDASFYLRAVILNLEKVDRTAAEMALEDGYGGTTVTEAMLSSAGHIRFDDHKDFFKALAVGLVVGMVESAINSSVKDVVYMLVSDLEVSEASKNPVTSTTEIQQKVADNGVETQDVTEVSDLIKYRTRIVTTANKANLKLDEAQALMFKQMAFAIAGVFAKGGLDQVSP